MVVIIYLVILAAAFFFLIVLPQRRRMAAHQALMASLDVGDEIVTSGGLHGTIRSLSDATAEVEVAPAVVVTIARGAIAAKVETTPSIRDDDGHDGEAG
ncbi:MAG TPA: preprotein translocase subunit YajC [Acidimicrobiia bacterium]|jgi:preprotein translocase subunit YajC